ncbi:phosphotransferase [Streptomyces qinzhouensis]|uniref:Phosphotransferase n=1 Tax=Streptomyces qinzhouensis TaxID=2599401 RepID=A0A5B8J4M2_9ACTN|nr:phosphotransferase [Streptomyces qinzhouensis]QDY75324.1 phosphotransferase [Streptomyces qinzhouensis]
MTHTQMMITADLVRDLLRDQHPDLADRPIALGARGWDNQLWRLGDDLAVRLPWATESADELLRKERAWLPALAPRLPLPVPVPQRIGEPSERFPRPWTVTTWVQGEPADRAPVTRGANAADRLAAFLTALHRPAPDAATLRRARGWAVMRALSGILIGDAGVHGRPGGKATWGPPAQTALRRLLATAGR